MLDELLKDEKITLRDYRSYKLFRLTDDGKAWFDDYKQELFMAMPDVSSLGAMARLDGTKNVFRQIEYALEMIDKLLKEV